MVHSRNTGMMKLYIDHNQPFDRYHPKNFLNLSDLTFTWTSKSAVITSLQWLSIALIFCLVYTVKPYYTGTQNTYFLHGLADAGYGLLNYDWLSNTKDTRPLFSFMIKIIYSLFN